MCLWQGWLEGLAGKGLRRDLQKVWKRNEGAEAQLPQEAQMGLRELR